MNDYNFDLQTPCFVIKTSQIDEQINNMYSSLSSRWNKWTVGYSVKTNNLPWIINFMKAKGIWAEVVSSDEYYLAKELGYEINKIIFNGPVKGKKEFIEAVENGAVINLDAKRELKWLLECDKELLKNARIGLRVNFCIEDYCPNESQCGQEDGRFGFSYETGELKEAIDFLSVNNIPLSGLHLHCSSKTRSLNVYNATSIMAARIAEKYKLGLQYVDIGGGFFGGMPGKPSFEDYFDSIKANLNKSKYTRDVEIIVEPGMAVIGANIDYITSVVDVKKTKNNNFVITDGSRTHIDPLMRKSGYLYQFEYFDKEKKPEDPVEQIISGFTCMEGDRFFWVKSTQLKEGDRIRFEKVGAYTMGMSPQFIEFYPNVYAETSNGVIIARAKRTAKDFIK